ncbi:MAG: ABC transporter permease [bacterium]
MIAALSKKGKTSLFRDSVPMAAAFLLRDLRIEASYRFNSVLKLAGIVFQLAIFYFVARLVPSGAVEGGYFPFVLSGLAFSQAFYSAMTAFGEALRREQLAGTLEQVMVSPVPPPALKAGLMAKGMPAAMVEGAAYFLAAALLFGVYPGTARLLALVPCAVLGLGVFAALGVISASFIMAFKRGDPVQWGFGAVSDLLGGVYFPVAMLPAWLAKTALMLPTTHALNAARRILAGGPYPWTELGILGLFLLVLWPAGTWSFGRAVEKARREGTLGHY